MKKRIIVALVVLEIVFFALCMFITLAAPPRSDGWIPSDIISRPMSLVFLVLHLIFVPRMLLRALKTDSRKDYELLGGLILAFLLIAIPGRGPWSWRFPEFVNYAEKKPEDLAMYARLLDDLTVIRPDNISITNRVHDEYYDCTETETLRDKVAVALKEAPAEYFIPPKNEQLRKNKNFTFGIQTFAQEGLGPHGTIDFYYNYDEFSYSLEPLALGTEGTTLVEVFFWNYGRFYLTMDNKYLDEIFMSLPKYKIDYTLRDRFFYDELPNAKAENCSVSATLKGEVNALEVTEDSFAGIVKIIGEFGVEYIGFESDEDFPTGDIEAHIAFHDCNTSLDFVYDYFNWNTGVNETPSSLLGVAGSSALQIRAHGKTEYFLVRNQDMDALMNLLAKMKTE